MSRLTEYAVQSAAVQEASGLKELHGNEANRVSLRNTISGSVVLLMAMNLWQQMTSTPVRKLLLKLTSLCVWNALTITTFGFTLAVSTWMMHVGINVALPCLHLKCAVQFSAEHWLCDYVTPGNITMPIFVPIDECAQLLFGPPRLEAFFGAVATLAFEIAWKSVGMFLSLAIVAISVYVYAGVLGIQ